MAESKLKIDVRRSKILEQLKLDGKVSVSRLAEELGATPVTIRNDLTALERDGYLVRMQGGAVIAPRLEHHLAGNTEDATFLQKQALAEEVAKLISDGQTIFFNAGTTTQHIARIFTMFCVIATYIGKREFCMPMHHPLILYSPRTAGAPQMQIRK